MTKCRLGVPSASNRNSWTEFKGIVQVITQRMNSNTFSYKFIQYYKWNHVVYLNCTKCCWTIVSFSINSIWETVERLIHITVLKLGEKGNQHQEKIKNFLNGNNNCNSHSVNNWINTPTSVSWGRRQSLTNNKLILFFYSPPFFLVNELF